MGKLKKIFSLELCLIIAIAIAVILRIINLDSRELWYDEVLSLLLSTGQKKLYSHPSDVPLVLADYQYLLSIPAENSLVDIARTLERVLKGLVAEPHPPLFFLGQHLWLRLWGNSVAAMRSLPVLYSLGAIFCSYNLGRKLLGYRGGLLLAAALGLNPFFFFHSLNLRMYCSLVFWTVLSAWATLELCNIERDNSFDREENKSSIRHKIIWSIILVISAASGLMTFYYFSFWLASLGLFALLLDIFQTNNPLQNIWQTILKSRRWQQISLLLFAGVVVTTPWMLWGLRQQLNNADLGRFKAGSNILETTFKHIEGILTTLGINLIIGDWASILSPTIINLSGIFAIAIITASVIYLWRKQRDRLLLTAISFSLIPLFLMVAVDVVSGKFTVGFGFGRSLIFILPGCLLLLVAAISKMSEKWQTYGAIALLLCYLTITVSDSTFRQRSMFHEVADIIRQQPDTPTLIVMNSTAWGHVLRLVYYLPSESTVELLARSASKLDNALIDVLQQNPDKYQRAIWLDSDRPVWSAITTQSEAQQIEQTIGKQFELVAEKKLIGTWELDNFDLKVYQK